MATLTYSAIQTFLTCPQKYRWRYVFELVPAKPWGPAMRFGSLIHHGLEALHGLSLRASDSDDANGHMIDAALASYEPAPDEHDLAVAGGMLRGYVSSGGLHGISAVTLEADLGERELMYDVSLRGKTDGLVDYKGGLWLIEHKTTARVTPSYVARISIDLQIHLYLWLAEQRWPGRPIHGVIYNVLPTPGLRRRRGESLDGFSRRVERDCASGNSRYVRVFVARDPDRVEEAKETAMCVAEQVRLGAGCKNTGACDKPYACGYLPLCTAKHVDAVIGTSFRREEPHSELVKIGGSANV